MATFMSRLFGQAAERVNYVPYIQSSGTQYFDVGVKPSTNTRVVMDVCPVDIGTGMKCLFGCRNANSATASQMYNLWLQGPNTVYSDYFGNRQTYNAVFNERMIADKNKNVCTVNGTTATNTAATGQATYNLFLLAINAVGTVGYFMSAQLYSCQIYESDVLIRDLWPCYDPDGVACLYDKVEKKYYYNAGTGEFLVGGADGGGEDVSIISFTIDGAAFEAEEGMTWAQFINSSYNNGAFSTDSVMGLVRYNSIYVKDQYEQFVRNSEQIVANATYTTA